MQWRVYIEMSRVVCATYMLIQSKTGRKEIKEVRKKIGEGVHSQSNEPRL
jgi:hypothetical protein